MDTGTRDGPGAPAVDAAQPVAVLEELLNAKGEQLLRTAVLLAGSRADGEDLLQAALERLFRRWRTIRGDPEGYLRQTLYHLAADGWRRNGAWRAAWPGRPPGVGARRHRRRPAVAGATAGFALTAGSPGTAPIRTTAYVVNRVSGALAATDAIGYSTSRLSWPGAPAVMTGPADMWQFGRRARDLIETAAGQPATDLMGRAEGRSLVLTIIDYQNRTWTSTTIQPDQQLTPTERNSLCSGAVQMLFGRDSRTAADWRHIIETGLKCGAFTVAGRQPVDGVDAIKLAGHKTVPDTTIWVDPSTYLPVRLVSHGQVKQVGSGAGNGPTALTVDFRWLPPTRANLAKLTVPIPAGFQKVVYPKQ